VSVPETGSTEYTANGSPFPEKPSTWLFTRSSDYTRYWSLCSILFPTWLCSSSDKLDESFDWLRINIEQASATSYTERNSLSLAFYSEPRKVHYHKPYAVYGADGIIIVGPKYEGSKVTTD